jgi:hypothetical protein
MLDHAYPVHERKLDRELGGVTGLGSFQQSPCFLLGLEMKRAA